MAILRAGSVTAEGAPSDRGWPRQVSDGGSTIVVYQPQLDSWSGNRLEGRSAVSVTDPASPTPTFGVAWFSARTSVDKASGIVTLADLTITRTSFPAKPDQAAEYQSALASALPSMANTIALSRLEANLAVTQAESGRATGVPVKNSPPEILFSQTPAILVLVDGEPALRAAGSDTSLLRVVNTRALILFDSSSATYFLYVMDRWASASSITGPWAAATSEPAGLAAAKAAATQGGNVDLLSNPSDGAKSELEAGVLPAIYVATGPAELLQSEGPPNLQPIAGTSLLTVQNSSSEIFLDTETQSYYVLVSGRWFTAPSLTAGPWAFVASDALPADFAKIPFTHPKATALTSVAGTPQAKEATISAGIPQTATVQKASASMPSPQYDGAPKFAPIETTELQYAVNTATPVVSTPSGGYYAVVNGVWFTSTTPTGPWVVADRVPDAIYAIPPSSPVYPVTYVRIYGSTPDVVYVGYTPGYYGTYVTPTGTVVYGTGWVYEPWVGTVWIGPPYTYGFGAGFAWGTATGFALGLTAGAFCHPWWGPAGWGWGWGWGGSDVNVHVNNVNVYNRWGHGTVVTTDGRYAGHVGNTTVLGNKGGDVYAGHDGNVYRRSDGSWQKYDSGSWNDVDKSDAKSAAQDRASGADRTAAQAGAAAQDRSGSLGGAGTHDGSAAAERSGGFDKDYGRQAGASSGVQTLGDRLGGLDRDYQARQLGDRSSSAPARSDGGWGSDPGRFGGGDGFAGGDRFGGDRLGGGFQRGGFGAGGFHGGGGFRR